MPVTDTAIFSPNLLSPQFFLAIRLPLNPQRNTEMLCFDVADHLPPGHGQISVHLVLTGAVVPWYDDSLCLCGPRSP